MTDIPEALRRRFDEPPRPALEEVRSFLRGYVSDGSSIDEVRDALVSLSEHYPQTVRRRLRAFDEVLKTEYPKGTLSRLVALDANVSLDDPSDENSARWLRQLANVIQQALEA